jgi:predicted metal-dependent HD superfamily phosphohydrolase
MDSTREPADVIASCWRRIAMAQVWDVGIAEPILAGLLAAYGEPARHYHNRAHIAALLLLAQQHADEMEDAEAAELAILFHDAVYDPTRSDNEQESARLD